MKGRPQKCTGSGQTRRKGKAGRNPWQKQSIKKENHVQMGGGGGVGVEGGMVREGGWGGGGQGHVIKKEVRRVSRWKDGSMIVLVLTVVGKFRPLRNYA